MKTRRLSPLFGLVPLPLIAIWGGDIAFLFFGMCIAWLSFLSPAWSWASYARNVLLAVLSGTLCAVAWALANGADTMMQIVFLGAFLGATPTLYANLMPGGGLSGWAHPQYWIDTESPEHTPAIAAKHPGYALVALLIAIASCAALLGWVGASRNAMPPAQLWRAVAALSCMGWAVAGLSGGVHARLIAPVAPILTPVAIAALGAAGAALSLFLFGADLAPWSIPKK